MAELFHECGIAAVYHLPNRETLRAAECLGVLGEGEPIPVLYQVVNSVETEAEALLALNTLVYLRDHRKLAVDPARLMPRLTGGQVARRLEYLRTTSRR